MLMMHGCGVLFPIRYTGAVAADAHDAWLCTLISVTFPGSIPTAAHDGWGFQSQSGTAEWSQLVLIMLGFAA